MNDYVTAVLDAATNEIQSQVLDASKAARVLSWSPAWPLERGLHETVAWYRDYLGTPGGAPAER